MEVEFLNSLSQEVKKEYGEEPNVFLKENIDKLSPGNLLLPAEGSGRNSVYAARKGWQSYAFDINSRYLRNATNLAKKYNVGINYAIGGYADVEYEPESMDVIAFIFAHVTPEVRRAYFRKFLKSLKPGGLILLEGFHKEQWGHYTGMNMSKEMLFDEDQLEKDFNSIENMKIRRSDRVLDEGPFHDGYSSLIQFIGYK